MKAFIAKIAKEKQEEIKKLAIKAFKAVDGKGLSRVDFFIKKENEELKEAVEKLEAISEDENMRRVAELREKAIRDEIWFKESGRKMGIKEGRKEGLEQGKEQGLEEGKKIKNIENAKKMLEKKIPIETIMEITGLTKEEIMN